MLKTISKTGVDVIFCLTLVVTVFLPCGDNSHNAGARKGFEPYQRSFVSYYGCSARLRHMADFIVLGLVLFLLMPLKS